MYHPISSKIENYSAPDGWLWFMYSNLELFQLQKACLCAVTEGQIANRTTFTPALLGRKLTSVWAAGAKSPLKQSEETEIKTLKNSFIPDFPLGCKACYNMPWWNSLRMSLQQCPRTARHCLLVPTNLKVRPCKHHGQPSSPCLNPRLRVMTTVVICH